LILALVVLEAKVAISLSTQVVTLLPLALLAFGKAGQQATAEILISPLAATFPVKVIS
jgi:hypothetical protein